MYSAQVCHHLCAKEIDDKCAHLALWHCMSGGFRLSKMEGYFGAPVAHGVLICLEAIPLQ